MITGPIRLTGSGPLPGGISSPDVVGSVPPNPNLHRAFPVRSKDPGSRLPEAYKNHGSGVPETVPASNRDEGGLRPGPVQEGKARGGGTSVMAHFQNLDPIREEPFQEPVFRLFRSIAGEEGPNAIPSTWSESPASSLSQGTPLRPAWVRAPR